MLKRFEQGFVRVCFQQYCFVASIMVMFVFLTIFMTCSYHKSVQALYSNCQKPFHVCPKFWYILGCSALKGPQQEHLPYLLGY